MKNIKHLRFGRLTISFAVISFIFFCCFVPDKSAKADTNVGGIISSNTVWSINDSPYIITNTVQIPEGVTLTIEPGVTVTKQSEGDMFLLRGKLLAHGTADKKIVFDGSNISDFFHITGYKNALVDIKYSIVKNGNIFWSDYGHSGYLLLRNSELINLNAKSSIVFPYGNSDISFNKFINTGGFRILASDGYQVTIKNNLFYNNKPDLSFVLEGYNDYYSDIVLKYNSFIEMDGAFLRLLPNSISSFSAVENYWGTQDASIIESMIYDKNDDIQCSGNIDYLPTLASAHSDTPITDTLVPDTCTAWEYSAWSACSDDGQQKRTIISSSPIGCMGGSPILSRSCSVKEANVSKGNSSATTSNENIAAPVSAPTIISANDLALDNILDGDIVQCKNSVNPFAVYIVKEAKGKKYLRHIVNLNIFNHYNHLQWGSLKQVDSLTGFLLSGWVRANTGPNGTAGANDKVYEINGDQTKHWINMTAEQFLSHGGSEDAIYNINQGELELYAIGADAMFL